MSSKDKTNQGPSFKDQFREADPLANEARRTTVVPLAEATPVNDSSMDERGPAGAARRFVELEERLQMVEGLEQQSQASHAGGCATKKLWLIIGLLSTLVVVLSSVAIVLATRSSPTVSAFIDSDVDDCEGDLWRLSTDRATVIRCFINSITLTSRTLSYPSQETPEEKALQWLISIDVTTSMFDAISLLQRYVLATIWFGNGPFGSERANHTESWITPMEECEWESVVECAKGEVTYLKFFDDGLTGTTSGRSGIVDGFAEFGFVLKSIIWHNSYRNRFVDTTDGVEFCEQSAFWYNPQPDRLVDAIRTVWVWAATC